MKNPVAKHSHKFNRSSTFRDRTKYNRKEVGLITSDGYIGDPEDWSEEFAKDRAETLGIDLTEDHWKIITFFREFSEEYGISPSSRVAQKEANKRFGIESKEFYNLFPNGPKQAAMISGLKKPSGC